MAYGEYTLSRKRIAEMEKMDGMSKELRECVHEFGMPIVTVLSKFGITSPNHMREVVKEIWSGGRQDGQRQNAIDALDVLMAHGLVNTKGLIRFLRDNNYAIVSMDPTRAMLDASLAEVSGFNVRVTKEEKHRRRLRAAIFAGAR